MSDFLYRFRGLLEEYGKPQKDICADLGIRCQKLSNWKTGYSEPNFDDLAMLAEYFDVSTDYLLGITDEGESLRTSTPAALPLDETQLLKSYRALSYAGKARVSAYADLLREQESGAQPADVKPTGKRKKA